MIPCPLSPSVALYNTLITLCDTLERYIATHYGTLRSFSCTSRPTLIALLCDTRVVEWHFATETIRFRLLIRHFVTRTTCQRGTRPVLRDLLEQWHFNSQIALRDCLARQNTLMGLCDSRLNGTLLPVLNTRNEFAILQWHFVAI